MSTFKFSAVSKHTHQHMPVEIFLGGHSIGFTPTEAGKWLEVELENVTEPLVWYAMIWNIRVAKGEATGGNFQLEINEHIHAAEITEDS